METEPSFNGINREGSENREESTSTKVLYEYANLLEELCIKGHHDATTLEKQEEIGFPISSKDISPGNIASAFSILAQAQEDLGENFQWDGEFDNPWTMKMQKAYLDFRGGYTQGTSAKIEALIQKRQQYLDDLRGKVTDTANFPEHEDDKQAADSLFHAFGRLQRIAEAYSKQD